MKFLCAYHGNLFLDSYVVHLAEMAALGFSTVVLCVPEHYVTHSLPAVRDLIQATHVAGLECWADPWRVAGRFDGEAPFDPTGHSEGTIAWWTDSLGCSPEESRPDAVFWDNPHPAEPYRIAAWGARALGYGMRNVVCLSADRHRDDPEIFRRVADLDVVHEVGTDPYCLIRNEGFDIEEHVRRWTDRMTWVTAITGKPAHVWVQTFGIDPGHEDLPVRAARVARDRGIGGIGVWSYGGTPTTVNRSDRYGEAWRGISEFIRV